MSPVRFAITLGLLASVSLTAHPCHAEAKRGALHIQVLDAASRQPLAAAEVSVVEAALTASTGSNGALVFGGLVPGSYTVEAQHPGYRPQRHADAIVKSDQQAEVVLELAPDDAGGTLHREETITVVPTYFPEADEQPLSLTSFSYEAVRRAAASAGDVSRFVAGLPSVAKVNDSDNSLVVRGGSPMENAFFLENIEIPNINHFPAQGSSGGPIGLVNVDFLQDVDFYAGGFPPRFGDRLSSVTELRFREGNREHFGAQLDLNFAGFGAVAEGPLGQRGSFMLSARRSFLDLLVDAIGTGVAPRYSDYQGKVVYELGTHHRLTALGIAGIDQIVTDREQAHDDGNSAYGTMRSREGAGGLNWQWLWSDRGFSDTSVSFNGQRFRQGYFETTTANDLATNASDETSWNLRHVTRYRVAPWLRTELSADAKRLTVKYDNSFNEYTDSFGQVIPSLTLTTREEAWKAGGSAALSLTPVGWLTTTLGARTDYSSASKRTTVDPRLSTSLHLGSRTTLSGSAGRFHQELPLILLKQHEANSGLADPEATHLVAGLSQLIGGNTRLTIEAYQKRYRHFPLDPTQPQLFVIDEPFERYGFFFNHETLVDSGEARARGIELQLERRASRGLYGSLNGALFRTQYRGLDGIWRSRIFDNRYLVGIEGGWKPNGSWEVSMRWNYAGGVPTTPFDEDASRALGRGVSDETQVNAGRLPDYHSLNLRVDRRFHFAGSNLIAYASVWNAYNRKNVAQRYWNEIDNRADRSLQWGALPIFGLQYEF
jgi:hypothetical protein